ncbi:MAG: 1-deoxy-D-xylulose-5-phosphate reductoisomerase [Candidatus Peregrinibacteria bacterium]|nr:1-deoxy-D-xylulose-5-phosphate reductoisomerase [Candidatus Peregrinibacteria bacterium]
MKKIFLLGATGSVGQSTLNVVRKNLDKFQIVGASAHSNFDVLQNEIAPEFGIDNLFDTRQKAGFQEFLKKCEPDVVLNSIVGFAGLEYSIEILKSKIPLALANKESLVAGGELMMKLAAENNTPILPVDSEHSAIFQCLSSSANLNLGSENLTNKSEPGFLSYKKFNKILLTCSGGPFFGATKEELEKVTLKQALKHPNWSMGAKITIDSATLANKCLEFFEAMHLFGANKEQIEIVIHRESIVHSMVEFPDSSVIAQLSPPNMELPIAVAFNYPDRFDCDLPKQSFKNLDLSFREPDKEVFKTLKVMEVCAERMKNFPIVFNAVNEVAVAEFLAEKIQFAQIFEVLEKTIDATKEESVDSLQKIFEIDKKARKIARKFL